MRCYCLLLAHEEVNRLKQEMYRAVDEYGYDHPTVHQISSQIDPIINAITLVQLHHVRYKQALESDWRAEDSDPDASRARADLTLGAATRVSPST